MPSVDTIAAVATAPGRGGIGVVRVSGPHARAVAEGLLGRVPPPRHAVLSAFRDAHGATLDQGIALFFTQPHSFTGEDVLELQGHGGDAVLQLILQRCVQLGARLAEPGEFTKRAFLNDKLDLAQAESVADLIDASTAAAARSAMRSLQGEFSKAVRTLVDAVVELRMLLEATLDFPEEGIDFLEKADAEGKLRHLSDCVELLIGNARQGRLMRDGIHVVLVGAPNVGKSSLLNRLAGEDVAIVTPVPGTTRDAIRERIHIDGVPLHVIDTAGLRETRDEVERIGIERTWAAIDKADVVLLLHDAAGVAEGIDPTVVARLPAGIPVIDVMNKIDLVRDAQVASDAALRVSARTGEGVERLKQVLLETVGWHGGGEGAFMARERHIEALSAAGSALAAAQLQWPAAELVAEELRDVQDALNTITGEFSADDLLGEIFSRFCIGK